MQQIDYPPIQHIEIRDGQARIAGRSVKVKMVISRLLFGSATAIEEVMEQYYLSRAEVLACLTYYQDYQGAIDQHFHDQEEAVHEVAIPLDDLLNQMRARRANTE